MADRSRGRFACARLIGLVGLATVAAGLIAGCASAPTPVGTDQAARQAPAGPGVVRRGAYYLDDGPAERAPDPESVAEPVPRLEPVLERTTRPYVIFGREYRPMARLEPYRARGVATWYGRRYHGNPTASGERYDMHALTAAHPILPIPSYARVTNLANGRSVIVRVNDRGPFLHGRLIDLSYTAAARLGYADAGTAQVEVELITQFDAQGPGAVMPAAAAAESGRTLTSTSAAVVAPVVSPAQRSAQTAASPPPAVERLTVMTEVLSSRSQDRAEPKDPSFWLQLGAFASADNAAVARDRLARQVGELGVQVEVVADGGMFKLQAGPWPNRAAAVAAADQLHSRTGFRPFTTQR